VYEVIQDELTINYEETSDDGEFSLLSVACIGCCSLAPVITIDGETFGRLNAQKLRKILRDFKRQMKDQAKKAAE
jgi:NADH-quinone oxidoreductase subunit E